MKHSKLTIIMILIVSVLAVHVFFMNTEGARVDMTETKLFSLTDGTQQILEKMKTEGVKPIEVKLYFSATTGKTLPNFIKQFIVYSDYVRNLMREYVRESDGKIRLSVIDPKPDSDEAEDATDYGLDGKPINQHGDKFFFGLAFETQTGSRDIIEFLWPEKQETIEYEISKTIYNLLWPKKKRVGVISSLDPLPDNNPYMQRMLAAQGKQPGEPWSIMTVLQESYEVEKIGDVDTIDKEKYDLVMVIHPKGLDDKTLWAIDEWVITGGDTLVFMDAYALDDSPPNNPQQPWAQFQYNRSANMDKLLNKWGLRFPQDTFAADYNMGIKMPSQRGGAAEVNVVFMGIDDRNKAETLNLDTPVFQGLTDIRFYTPGVLEKADDAPGEVIPLITTTEAGDSLKVIPGFGDKGLAYPDFQDPGKLLRNYSSSKKQMLAALVTGQMPSAFPEGATFPKETPQTPPGMPPGFQMPVPEDAEMVTKEAVPADQHQEARIMVFSDVDFISNQLAFQQSFFGLQAVGDNYKVLLNSIDFMLGARELMAVRSKENIARPFKVFDEIERRADADMLEEENRIRTDIETFQTQLREKQGGISQKNAVLFQKKMGDEIAELNKKIDEGNKRLREIRKTKRSSLEGTESTVRFMIVALMPIIVCVFGLFTVFKRRTEKQGRG
ncbi:MAG: GldG family protein [Acidobacteriota bacterium]|nr:GldG family protein [Acidobacteriota bacterium]